MKKITLLLFAFTLLNIAKAQKVYFIYLQSENQQPFYARMGEKIHNSSSGGYLLLSKLRDSVYSMNIGAGESQMPEQTFSVSVNKKDQGFLVKNFREKGWGLFNLQSLGVIMPEKVNAINIVKTEKREPNSFTDLLAKAADDSTLKEKPVMEQKVTENKTEESLQLKEGKPGIKKEDQDSITAKKEVNKKVITPDEKKQEQKKDSFDSLNVKRTEEKKIAPDEKKEILKVETKTVKENSEGKNVLSSDQSNENKPGINPGQFKKPTIIKRSESSTTEGFGIIFFDTQQDGTIDTIKILIPVPKQNLQLPNENQSEIKFLDINSQDSLNIKKWNELNQKPVSENSNQVISENTIVKNNKCIQIAADEDFFKLRKKWHLKRQMKK